MPQLLAVALTYTLTSLGASAAFTATVSAAVLSSTGTALINIAASVGLSLLAQMLLRPESPKPQDGQVNIRQPIPVRKSGYGRCRLGGAYMLYEIKDGNSCDVLALHDGRVDGFEKYYLHDDIVEVDPVTGQVSHEFFYREEIFIFTTLGEDTETAFEELIDTLDDENVYSEDHRGDGVASLGLLCIGVGYKGLNKVYPNGLPSPNVVARLQPVWDPRDEEQSRGDPNTWLWSANPILCLLDYLLSDRGMRLNYANYIQPRLNEWRSAADACDVLIALKGGGAEPRYECHGVYNHDTSPSEVIKAILSSCDGWLVPGPDGSLGVRAGVYEAPTVTLTSAHIREFAPEIGQPADQRTSVLRARYTSPDHEYSEQDADEWRDEDLVIEFGERVSDADLLWVQSHAQARRLMKRLMARISAPTRGSMVTDALGFDAIGERYITIEYPEIDGFESFVAEITEIEIDPETMGCRITWLVADPLIDQWDPETEEGTAPAVPEVGAGAVIATPENLAVNVRGDDNNPYLRLIFDTYPRTDLAFEIQYRLYDDGDGPGSWESENVSSEDTNVSGGNTRVETGGVLPNKIYQVRVAAVTPGGLYSNYASLQYVITGEDTPPEPVLIDGSALGGGNAEIEVTAASTPDFMMIRIWRALSSDGFGDAEDVSGQIFAEADEVVVFVDTPPVLDEYKYWATAEVAANKRSAETSSVTIDVTA